MAPHDRRVFLRGLATLPLIGGSVALVGSPTAAAVEFTPELATLYVAWLAREHAAAVVAHSETHYPHLIGTGRIEERWTHQPMSWFPPGPSAEAAVRNSSVASRAAVILAAAGVPLTGGAS